ncbi:MAG: POTRA domain-containing protein [Panacagrimonas sp.]
MKSDVACRAGRAGREVLPAYLPLALVLLVAAVCCDLGGLDHAVAAHFYDATRGAFPARHAFWAEDVLHRGGIWLVVLTVIAAGGVLAASLRYPRLRTWRREAVFVLASIALTTGAVALVKQSTDIDCPWDVAEYGGENAYVHVFQAKAPGSARNHCFPGAHSSGGFSLMAVAFVVAVRRRQLARQALAASFLLGLGYAATQWARGAHFPSHDLWSALVAWSAASLLARRMLFPATVRVPDPRAVSAAALVGAVLMAGILLQPGAVQAGAQPPIREIAFRGNEVTLPEVMLREMSIAPGQPADEDAIEASRQAVQNLGLFRSVVTSQEPLDDGVRVIFTVREKWYLLPYPRLSANTDGQNSVGAELRWNNIGGRNQSLRALVSSADRQDEGRGRQLSFLGSYRIPFVFDSPYTLDLSGSHAATPVESEITGMPEYDETVDEANVLLSRKFGMFGSASQGWSAGGGLLWRREDTSGIGAPDPYGDAYAVQARMGFKNVQDRIFSETGTRFSIGLETADQHLLSDYSYTRVTLDFKQSLALGSVPHQTFEWGVEAGNANGGPRDKSWDFSLGGTNGLRGYERNSFQGDFYYLVNASYLRPLYWDWLRLVAGVEAGNVYKDADQINTEIRWSFNLGLRVRLTQLVNVEFEAGIALPMDDDSGRIYGSRNGF